MGTAVALCEAVIGVILAGGMAGLASAPHCAGMCGPIAAATCVDARSGLRYGLGRLGSYAFTGALAGGMGHALLAWLDAPIARGVASLLLGLGLALSAWRLYSSRVSRAPKLVSLLQKSDLSRRPAAIGVLTGFLPCGALIAGLTLAAASGSIVVGALTMLAFALGSSLGLVGAGWLATRLRREGARKVVAVVLALGAIVCGLRAVDSFRAEPVVCHVEVAAISGDTAISGGSAR